MTVFHSERFYACGSKPKQGYNDHTSQSPMTKRGANTGNHINMKGEISVHSYDNMATGIQGGSDHLLKDLKRLTEEVTPHTKISPTPLWLCPVIPAHMAGNNSVYIPGSVYTSAVSTSLYNQYPPTVVLKMKIS